MSRGSGPGKRTTRQVQVGFRGVFLHENNCDLGRKHSRMLRDIFKSRMRGVKI